MEWLPDSLTGLDLEACPCVSDDSACVLGTLTNLTSLCIQGCMEIGDAGVQQLRSLKSLTSFWLSSDYSYTVYRVLSDEGIAALSKTKALQLLHLAADSVSPQGLSVLTRLKDLCILSLDLPMPAGGTRVLGALKSLKDLRMESCKRDNFAWWR